MQSQDISAGWYYLLVLITMLLGAKRPAYSQGVDVPALSFSMEDETASVGLEDKEAGLPMPPEPLLFGPPAIENDWPNDLTTAVYAGGAVRLQYDPKWQASELIAGQEIHLVLTQSKTPRDLGDLANGLWIGYRFVDRMERDPADAISSSILDRLARATRGRARPLGASIGVVDGYPAKWQEFEQAVDTREMLRGFHLLVRTKLGWFELHAIAPEAQYLAMRAEVGQMLNSLRLSDPMVAKHNLPRPWAGAGPLVGTWKAISSKMAIRPDGTVDVEFDRQKSNRLDETRRFDFRHPVIRLTGRFEAQGDILRITWSDGSRLNYRWRLDSGSLLLTDHHGRVSQLERLFR